MRIIKLSESLKIADDVRNLTKKAQGMPLSDAVFDLANILVGTNLQWALCGGLAVGVHARPRGTDDIDIMIGSESTLDLLLLKAIQGNFKKTRDHAITHKRTGVEVELLTPEFLKVSPEVVRKAIETAIPSQIGKTTIPVISREGLVATKLFRASDYDRGDIKAVIQKGGDIDLTGWPVDEKSLVLLEKIKEEIKNA